MLVISSLIELEYHDDLKYISWKGMKIQVPRHPYVNLWIYFNLSNLFLKDYSVLSGVQVYSVSPGTA